VTPTVNLRLNNTDLVLHSQFELLNAPADKTLGLAYYL